MFRRREAADETYTFKHALICDAAYDSMLRSRRCELHAAIVDALESDTTDKSWPSEVLGYHCARAGQLEKAAQHYRKAASSPQRFAEMQGLLERALEADPTSVTSLTMLANVLMNRTHMFGLPINNEEVSRAGELIARARALSPDSIDVLASHASWLRARFRFAEAYPVLQRLAAIEPERSATHLMLGVCNAEMNRLEDALADFLEALRLDPTDPDLWLRHWRIGETLGLLGRDDRRYPGSSGPFLPIPTTASAISRGSAWRWPVPVPWLETWIRPGHWSLKPMRSGLFTPFAVGVRPYGTLALCRKSNMFRRVCAGRVCVIMWLRMRISELQPVIRCPEH